MKDIRLIPIFIFIISALFVAYLLYPSLREYFSSEGIDPNFLLGFIAVITLLISIWQGSKDRRLTYNMSLYNTLRENGLAIIGKLVAIRTKSEILLNTIKSVKMAIKNKVIFIDGNNTVSKKDIEDGFQVITAYADTYFQEECEDWNEMLNKLSKMGTDNLNVLKNYEANLDLIKEGIEFSNPVLDRIDEIINENEKLKEELEEITTNIRNRIVTKINKVSADIKEKL